MGSGAADARAVILACIFLIDFMFFEDGGEGPVPPGPARSAPAPRPHRSGGRAVATTTTEEGHHDD